MPKAAILIFALCIARLCYGAQPVIDNDRVTVWNVTWSAADPNPIPAHQRDFVTIWLETPQGGSHRKGEVRYAHSGASELRPGEHVLVIELKDHSTPPIVNKSGYPPAFPRPHVRKVLDNDKIIVWSYAWNPGEPTPMHFHDKDVVVVYLEDTALKSITPDGKTVLNEYKAWDTRFNPGNRVHSELLARGTGSAIITELK